jgi:hypothetical protein
MATSVAFAAGKSNLKSAKVGGIANKAGGINSLTASFLKETFPQDLYASVARLLGLQSKRAAEHRVQETRKFSADDAAAILCSQLGGRYIKALMDALPAERRPDWYVVLEPLMDLADAKKLLLVARSKTAKAIRKTVDAEDELSATIRRAETFSVFDPEFAGPQLDALRSFGRAEHRPMAQTKRGRRK